MTVTREEAIELLEAMVKIDSVTPWLIPGGAGEGEVAAFIRDWLADVGLEATLEEVEPGRPNVLAWLRGRAPGPTICLSGHIDTVGYANWADRALHPVIEGDRMIGLGVADDKGACATAMLAVRELVRSGTELAGNILVALVIDEEGISIGTEHLVAHHADEIDYAINLEPDGSGTIFGEHQGFGWIDIIVHGEPAHGSAPDKGVDAIVHMAEVVTRLHRLDETRWKPYPDPKNGRTVFHTGTIRGGTDYATYPNQAVLGIEIGTQPGETLADRVAEIEAIFAEVAEVEPRFRGEVNVRLDRDPFTGAGNEVLLQALGDATEAVNGVRSPVSGLNAWTDAALFQSAGIPTVLFGPEGGNYHAAEEWVSIPDVVATTEILRRAVVALIGAPVTEKS
ncbi:acetylornithine deacetylase [Mycolicibacterium anyangense]|uniref:Acetylornithine deacetylase n=1 Tax=Mycolicibacterium anyangense TaxID=1431246 RepID=A0A6N4W1E8_9MYCO|nr:M20/M25/M40 family metallo-hydrolase [Mycolicibacterium anyangense]BBZ75690.1 acetylornithine deacetylase [Mycolicibacterium anyangense]